MNAQKNRAAAAAENAAAATAATAASPAAARSGQRSPASPAAAAKPRQRSGLGWGLKLTLAWAWIWAQAGASAQPAAEPPLQSLPQLMVQPYLGTWYQVALFPNRFQKQCVSDTSATYSLREDGTLRVLNRCRQADGRFDEAVGQARPTGQTSGSGAGLRVQPAQLEVSFLPAALRWLPVGWGRYWVLQLADDGRYAVVSEPTREYLWVLSRTPKLAAADEAAIRSRLQEQGFGTERLARWQTHAHGSTAP